MTIEEKAKAYDEAVKKAKKLYEQGTITESLNYVFPELRKSDDERIKKAQLDYWRSVGGKEWHGVPVQEVIAWLEKQENKPQGKTALETWKDMRLEVYQQASGNRHEPNYSDDTTKMFSLNDIDEIIEKMSEQKPTLRERYENIGKSEWFKKTHVGISIGKQPLEEDVVGMGELGKIWDEKQDPILQRLDRIYDLLLHKLDEKIIINNPFPRLTETPYKPGEVWCGSSAATSEKGGEE